MKYRKETEEVQLQQMSFDAYIELFKSGRYNEEQMAWFMDKMSTVLAENYVYTIKSNITIITPLFISLFLFGIAIGRLFQ